MTKKYSSLAILTKSENMIRYTPADLKQVLYLITQVMSLEAFGDQLRDLKREGEERFDRDFNTWLESQVPKQGTDDPLMKERFKDKHARLKEELLEDVNKWGERVVKSSRPNITPLCKALNATASDHGKRHIGELRKSTHPENDELFITYNYRGFLDRLFSEFRPRLLTALEAFEESKVAKEVPQPPDLEELLKAKPVEPLAHSLSAWFIENFETLVDSMVRDVGQSYEDWITRLQSQKGTSAEEKLALVSHKIKGRLNIESAIRQVCQVWLKDPSHLEPLYRGVLAYARAGERLALKDVMAKGDVWFRFGDALRTAFMRYEPQIAELYDQERGGFGVPEGHEEKLKVLMGAVNDLYAESMTALENEFEAWIRVNRLKPTVPEPFEKQGVREIFSAYVDMMIELNDSWGRTILLEEAPNITGICVDWVKATEKFVARETDLTLIQMPGRLPPKVPNFSLLDKVKRQAKILLQKFRDLEKNTPEELKLDLPRGIPTFGIADIPEGVDREEWLKEKTFEMLKLISKIVGREYEAWIKAVEADASIPKPERWKERLEEKAKYIGNGVQKETETWLTTDINKRSTTELYLALVKLVVENPLTLDEWADLPAGAAPSFHELYNLNRTLEKNVSYVSTIIERYSRHSRGGATLQETGRAMHALLRDFLPALEPMSNALKQDFLTWMTAHEAGAPANWKEDKLDEFMQIVHRTFETLIGLWFSDCTFTGKLRKVSAFVEAIKALALAVQAKGVFKPYGDGSAEDAFDLVGTTERFITSFTEALAGLQEKHGNVFEVETPVEEKVKEPVLVDSEPEDSEPEDPAAYAEILQKGRRILDANKEKVGVIENKTGNLTGIVRLGQACIQNFKRLLDCPLEHTIRQAQMIVEHMECFLELHEVNPADQTVRGLRRREGEFARKFLEIGLMSGVEPGVVDQALKEAQAAMDVTLIHRQECLDKLDEMSPAMSALRARIEQYNLGIDRAALSLARLYEEQSVLVLPVDGQIDGMELAIAELEPLAGEGDLDDLKRELQVMKEVRARGEELLNEIPRLESNLATTREKRAKAQEELDALVAQQVSLDQQVASIEAQQSLFRERVLEAVQGLLTFSNQLKHD